MTMYLAFVLILDIVAQEADPPRGPTYSERSCVIWAKISPRMYNFVEEVDLEADLKNALGIATFFYAHNLYNSGCYSNAQPV